MDESSATRQDEALQALLRSESARELLFSLHGRACLGEILSEFAHQLRNSLNSIANGADLLQERGHDQALREKIVPVMHRASSRMVELLDALDEPLHQHDPERCDLTALLERCVLMSNGKSRNVALSVVEPAPHWVALSADALRPLVLGLLSDHLACKPASVELVLQTDTSACVLVIRHQAGTRPFEDHGPRFTLLHGLAASLGGALTRSVEAASSTLSLPGWKP